MPTFSEDVIVENSSGAVVARIDQDASLTVRDKDGNEVFKVAGDSGILKIGTHDHGGRLEVCSIAGPVAVYADADDGTLQVGNAGNAGRITVLGDDGETVLDFVGANANLTIGAEDTDGDISVLDTLGRDALRFSAGEASLTLGAAENEGRISILDHDGRAALFFNAGTGTLILGGNTNLGGIRIRDTFARESLVLRAEDNGDGSSDATLTVGAAQTGGVVHVNDATGRNIFHMHSDEAQFIVGAEGNPGDIYVRDDAGANSVHISGSGGDIILAGADLAEDFQTETPLPPGTVVVAAGADEVAPASEPLDRRVVGVASGAGSFKPALRLGSKPGDQRVPIAIAGRAYCKADASHGAIAVGDMLTTSETPGHAMRVPEASAAHGAVLGKALEPLAAGTGLVAVLLTLG